MTAQPTILLILSLTTVAFSASAPTEPNDATPELTFQMNSNVMAWVVEADVDGESVMYQEPGAIRPKYMAKIILPRMRNRVRMITSGENALAMAKGSPLAQQCSQAQKEFLAQGFAAWVDTSAANIPKNYSVNFYAVSKEDAKIMARALLNKCAERARREVAFDRDKLKECQERLKQNQIILPEKEKQLEQAEKDYEVAKSATYPLSDDGEAAQLARELILQMDRQAKTLDIDWAGMRGKLDVIDQYLSQPDLNNDVIETLEAQRIELMVELSGLEARRRAIRKIRDEQHHFCTLLDAWDELMRSVAQLKQALKEDEEGITVTTWSLENPPDYKQPPKVYQNKIILYPIENVGSQN